MGIVTPVMSFDAEEARKIAAPANSSGSDHSPLGMRATTLSLYPGSSRPARLISVLIKPGAIALTRIPSSANARANDLVRETTPVLAAPSAGARGDPK